jgi:type II secretory pathway pseudopilin PulG
MYQEFTAPAISKVCRRGTTLLELLAVVLILLMITAMAIPAVAPAVSGRRMREGARMVSTFLNAARNRTIETGRPAGVWFERTPGLPEVCENLYMADVPQVYAGDFLDSTVECVLVDKTGTPWNSTDNPGQQDYWNVVIPRTRTMYMADSWSAPDPSVQTLVREGDLIQFDGYDRMFPLKIVTDLTITTKYFSASSWWYFLRGRNCKSAPTAGYSRERSRNGRYVIRWWDGDSKSMSWYNSIRTSSAPGVFDRPGLRYKIYRQPQRMMAGSMRLPRNVVIDLNFSAMTNGGRDVGIPFHPRFDSKDPAALDTNTNTIPIAYWGDPIYPNDNTPVIVVFSANGNIDRVYHHARMDNTGTRWSWGADDPTGSVYLLIGDREHVTPESYQTALFDDAQNSKNLAIQMKKNWLNLDALWIRVAPNDGLVSTSLVDDPKNTDAYLAADANAATIGADPSNVLFTRSNKGMAARTIGGR